MEWTTTGRLANVIRRVFVAAVAVPLAAPTFAHANKFNTETSASARALGMGNAAINTERGSYSVFYNPANIAAKETKGAFQLVNFQFDANEGLLQNASSFDSALNFLSLGNLYAGLKTDPNKFVGGRFAVYPNVTLRNLSLGMIYEVSQGAEVRASDGALIVKARNRFAPVAALSYRLMSGILRLGVSAQYLTVGNADSIIKPPISTSVAFSDSIDAGSDLVTTGGLTVSLPFRFLPSFSLVARNLPTGARFKKPALIKWGKGTNVGESPMMFDFGVGMTIYLARRLELKLEGDYRDLTNRLQGGRFRHVFAGGELILYDILRFRMGVAHGYLTYGFGIVTRKAALDVAAYADEKEDRLRGNKDQRYVLQYTWGLFK